MLKLKIVDFVLFYSFFNIRVSSNGLYSSFILEVVVVVVFVLMFVLVLLFTLVFVLVFLLIVVLGFV